MIVKKILFVLLFSIISFTQAKNSLRVKNPDQFEGVAGSIKETTLAFRPLGAYMKCEMFLTFTPGEYLENSSNTSDLLEVIYEFELPEKAIITESWLWINDVIVPAKIKDINSAIATFEAHVNRKKDPSILYKRSDTQYELRVFPLGSSPESFRKIKVTYLLPVDWTSNKVSISLPTDMLTSYETIEDIEIRMYQNDEWQNPLINLSGENTSSETDMLEGNYSKLNFTNENIHKTLHVSYDNPAKNGIYINRYRAGVVGGVGWGYYSLAVIPSLALDKKITRDFAVIIDLDEENTPLTTSEILNQIKTGLKSSLNTNDRFKLTTSNTWINATPAAIDLAIDNLDITDLINQDLLNLFTDARDFIKNSNSTTANILCLSNSEKYDSVPLVDDFINTYDLTANQSIEINIIDFDLEKDTPFYFKAGIHYKGNSLLFDELTQTTSGTHSLLKESEISISLALSQTISSLDNLLSNISLETGYNDNALTRFTFDQLDLNPDGSFFDQAILRVGKYIGEDTIYVIITENNGNNTPSISALPTINKISDSENDSTTKKMWTGEKIRQLSLITNPDNQIKGQIITLSETEQIISPLTAFLAVEPDDTDTVICNEFCKEEIVSIIPNWDYTLGNLISIYPNPTNSILNIDVLQENFTPYLIEIYDINGIKVYEKEITKGIKNIQLYLEFLTSGIYHIKLLDDNQVKTLRFNKL